MPSRRFLLAAVCAAAVVPALLAAAGQPPIVTPREPTRWPMLGGTPARNMVNTTDRNPLETIDAEKGPLLLWKADLGSRSFGQPVVAGGRVFVGTNNERPRNKRDYGKNTVGEVVAIDKSCLYCFDALTGNFLWQAAFDKLESGQVNDWPYEGLCSPPTVEGNRVYFATNRCTVVCLDANGFADGNQGFQGEKYKDATDADILWEFDMRKELGVFPHNMTVGSPLIVGDLLFTPTGNGVDEGHFNIPAPQAPSLICLDKNTGKLIWKDNSPGKDIMHGQWSQPSYTDDPVPMVIAAQGDGWVRGFEPSTGRLLWKFDANPKDGVYELGGAGTKNDFIASPVVHCGRVYIPVGQDPEHSDGIGRLCCIDLEKAVANGRRNPARDVSPELVARVEKRPKERDKVFTKPNPDSAAVWVFGGEETRPWSIRDFKFGRAMGNATVVGTVVYATELPGYVTCLDADTGEPYWQFDTKASIWSSPYYVDGRVLVTNEMGDLLVFRHDPRPERIDVLDFKATDHKDARAKRRARQKEVADKYLVTRIEFDAPVRATPCVAGGLLYLNTEKTLYCIGRRPSE